MKQSLSSYVFASKYPKYLKEEERRETYEESVDRVMDMHEKRLPLPDVRAAYKDKVIAGSQRGLQFGGAAIEEKNARIYNCVVSHCDRVDFFKECFWLLLCGCGAGFSVQKHHVARLPDVMQPERKTHFVVEDSIEGWALAVQALMTAYLGDAPRPSFDFSKVRPKGAPLRHGGLAPGPAPLEQALVRCEAILRARIGESLRPIDCFDITMHLADAVISGGIRRSATIAVFSPDDEEMVHAKTGNWFVDNPQRGRANISAMLLPSTPKSVYDGLFSATKQFGEPGFIFANSSEYLYNPCVEIGMAPILVKYKGLVLEEYTPELLDPAQREDWVSQGYTFESGWQMCNLATINCSRIHSDEDFIQAVNLATTLGTVQASYTSFPFLGEVTEQIVQRESLLGVSMTGILSNPRFYNAELLSKAKLQARLTNKHISAELGIPEASRITCVKPEGTASIVLGTSAGIHPYHARKYIRRVQADMLEPLYQEVERSHPQACSKSVWGAETQRVIAFPCEAPPEALVKSDLNAIQHLEIAKTVNLHWVRGAELPRCHDLHHNVSITVSVDEDEWEEVQAYIWENRQLFTGISLLSSSGDYDYQQPPYQEVHDVIEEDDANYGAKVEVRDLWNQLSALPEIDMLVHEDKDNTEQMAEVACPGGACDLPYSYK